MSIDEQENDLEIEVLQEGDDDVNPLDVEVSEEEPEIEVIDTTPEDDRGKPLRADGEQGEVPSEDEIRRYGKRAQERIRKLKYEFHTERRTKEENARQRDEAVNFARAQMAENQKLKQALQQGEVQLVTNSKAGAEAALREAEQEYRQAVSDGDTEKMLDASKKIAQATISLNAVNTYRPQYQQPAQPTPQPQVQQPQPQVQQPQTQPQVQPAQPQTSEQTADWLSRNGWYGRDHEMTRYAQMVDERLRFREGIDPAVDEKRYWSEVDKLMRAQYPERFDVGSEKPRGRTVVASATRTPSAQPKKVTITASEAALAARLGLSNEQYAREKQRIADSEGE